MPATNTTRTLEKLRRDGYTVAVVEKWNPHVKIRQDLFGFIDVLAIRRDETLAVQACSYGDVSKRVKKIAEHKNVGAVREAGWRIEVWGWRKPKRGWRKPKTRWECRVVDVS